MHINKEKIGKNHPGSVGLNILRPSHDHKTVSSPCAHIANEQRHMVWLRLAILYRIAYCIHLCDVCCLIVQYENVVLNLGTIPTGNNCSVMPSRQGSSRRLGGVQVQHSSLYRKRGFNI